VTVVGQAARDADRRVPGERAHLDRLPRAGDPDQHRQQLALVVRDLHPRTAAELSVGLLREVAQHVVGVLGVGQEVVVDGGADDVHDDSLAQSPTR